MFKFFLILIFTLLSVSKTFSKEFKVADFEKLGFLKGDQQWFQMIGAIDGWSGKINDEFIEVYFFKNKRKINREFFESMAPGDTWKNWCEKGNVALITKGDTACSYLKKLK